MSERLTALDATFLELEEADDSAHMHIGAVMVFDPLPGGGAPSVDELRRHLERGSAPSPATASGWGRPGPGACAGPAGRRIRPSTSPGTFAARPSRGPVTTRLWPSGPASSSPTGSTAPDHCGRPSWSRACRAVAGLSGARPTTAWSTASARLTSATCCWTPRPMPRPSRRRRAPRAGTRLRPRREAWVAGRSCGGRSCRPGRP